MFSLIFKYFLNLNPFPNKPWFLPICSTSLLKILGEKEKLLVASNFSFSHSVFYSFEELSAIWIVVKRLQFGRVQSLSFGKGNHPFPKKTNFRLFRTKRVVTSIFCISNNILYHSGNKLSFLSNTNFVVSKILLCCKELIHYLTMPHFDALKIYSCWKHCEKRRNCL